MVRFRAVGDRIAGGLLPLALFAAVSAIGLGVARAADSPSRLRSDAAALRAQNGSLEAREQSAWLSAVSLQTRLEQSEAALARLRARAGDIARRRAEAQQELGIARRSLRVAEQRLATRLRALYEEGGDTDPLAVVLGASSVSEALEGLDSLDRMAGQDREYVGLAKAARVRLVRRTRLLAAHEAEARRAADAAAATAAALAAARREQQALAASLRAQRRANTARVASLDADARVLAASRPTPSVPAAPASGGKTLTVTATGYALSGTTATGVPVGWGVVAVDPSVIPLGTRMTIPGYGAGVAADTGGAVQGATIDLWFPTTAEALSWGTRTVTITLR